MLQRFDGADALAERRRGLLQAEVTDDAQQDDLALVVGQLAEQRMYPLGVQRVDCLVLGAAALPGVGRGVVLDGRAAAAATAQVVDEAMVRHGEDEGAQVGFVAAKRPQPLEHREEHVAGQILGLTRATAAQVTGDGGRVPLPDLRQCPGLTPPGGFDEG